MATVIGTPGPFQVIDNQGYSDPNAPISPPRRRYDCSNYENCLVLAAALNWDSFTCRGCNGEINPALFWRAHQAEKRDKLVQTICKLPALKAHQTTGPLLVEINKRTDKKIAG